MIYHLLIKVPMIIKADSQKEAIDIAISRAEEIADGAMFPEDGEVDPEVFDNPKNEEGE